MGETAHDVEDFGILRGKMILCGKEWSSTRCGALHSKPRISVSD
jgi:hypothetical protein